MPKKIAAGKSSKRTGSATKVRSGSILSQASEEGGEGDKQPHPVPRERGSVCVCTQYMYMYILMVGSSPTRGSQFFFENDCFGQGLMHNDICRNYPD